MGKKKFQNGTIEIRHFLRFVTNSTFKPGFYKILLRDHKRVNFWKSPSRHLHPKNCCGFLDNFSKNSVFQDSLVKISISFQPLSKITMETFVDFDFRSICSNIFKFFSESPTLNMTFYNFLKIGFSN